MKHRQSPCGLCVFLMTVLAGAHVLRAQAEWPAPAPELLARAHAVLEAAPLIDGHNDLPSRILELLGGDLSRVDLNQHQPELPADIPRLRQGRVGAQFWSAFVDSSTMQSGGALRRALTEIDLIHRIVEAYPDLKLALTTDDIEEAHRRGKIASLIGLEGGHAIESSLPALRMLYRLGVRYMTLTHFATTNWADAATDFPRHGGLTELGERIVREMNRLGIFVDLSHVSPHTMRDVLRVSRAPVIFSHSGARAISAHVRNVGDDILKLLPANGGVIMVDFIAGYTAPRTEARREPAGVEAESLRLRARPSPDEPAYVIRRLQFAEKLHAELDDDEAIARRLEAWQRDNPPPRGTVADVADHIEHIINIAGIDHVGIGSDFYDQGGASMAVGLEDCSKYPILFAELLKRGHTEEELKSIAGGNLLRAMRKMEHVARQYR